MTIDSFSLDDSQKALVQIMKRKAKVLAQEHADRIRELFRDTSITLQHVGAELVPATHAINPKTAARVVSLAAKLLLEPEEYKRLVTERRTIVGQRLPTKLESGGALLKKAIEARGKVPWSTEEQEFFLKAVDMPQYQHPKESRFAGKPNLEVIATLLNTQFHNEQKVRDAKSLPAIRRAFLQKKGTYKQLKMNTKWRDEENQRLQELAQTELHVGGKHRFNGTSNFERIATILNEEFYAHELKSGTKIRNGPICSQHLRELKRIKEQESKDQK